MRLDRLLGILVVLLQNNRVSAPSLAEKFEVCRRTIRRDIDALCQAGIPIVTRQGANGGISIAEGYRLEKGVLTTEELSNIIAALRGLGTVSGQAKIERTLEKFSIDSDAVISLKKSLIIDLSSHYRGSLTPKIELLRQAIRDNRLISFDYDSEKGHGTRRIEPYYITFQWNSWYVFGYCLQRLDWRLFKLSRLWVLALCEDSFTPREIPSERKNFNACFADRLKLVAQFDSSVRYQLVDAYGPHCFTEMEDGILHFEIGYTNRTYILQWLLGFGDRVKVLEPLDLAKEIQKIAKKMFSNYK